MVGIFFILVGLLLLIYWALIPLPQKQQIINEIMGENTTETISNYSSSTSNFSAIQINNIYLSNEEMKIVVSQNYQIGNLIDVYQIPVGNINLYSNFFSGSSSKTIYFYYNSSIYDGIYLKFYMECSNGNVVISVNGQNIYNGCSNGNENIYVSPTYLIDGNNQITVSLYPSNIFSNAESNINDFEIIYAKRSSLTFNYYYYGGRVFINYNFCPADPNSVELIVNGEQIPLTSCSTYLTNNPLEITYYLNNGLNTITFSSQIPINLTLEIDSDNNLFYYSFSGEYYMLEVVKGSGSGTININGICTYNLNENQNIFVANIENCIVRNNNLLVIKPNMYLHIYTLYLS